MLVGNFQSVLRLIGRNPYSQSGDFLIDISVFFLLFSSGAFFAR
jgi:hypothetical protein